MKLIIKKIENPIRILCVYPRLKFSSYIFSGNNFEVTGMYALSSQLLYSIGLIKDLNASVHENINAIKVKSAIIK